MKMLRQELSNANLFVQLGFDTVEKEPSKFCPIFVIYTEQTLRSLDGRRTQTHARQVRAVGQSAGGATRLHTWVHQMHPNIFRAPYIEVDTCANLETAGRAILF